MKICIANLVAYQFTQKYRNSYPLNRVFKIVVGCILLLFISLNVKAGGLEKAFEALNIHDYFKAKDRFYKTLKKQPAVSAYGLVSIYSKNNNPFYNLDSALYYSKMATSSFWLITSEKQKLKYKSFGLDTVSICSQRDMVDEKCFISASEQNTIEAYNYFITQNKGALRSGKAIINRNILAFNNAKKMNTSSVYKFFLETYPKANQTNEVNARYQKRLFKEYTAAGTLESNLKFIEEQPTNFYVTEAKKSVYGFVTEDKTLQSYLVFVRKYPTNPSVPRAWRNIYNISTQEKTLRSIKKFLMDYPEYPFKGELEQDYILANTTYYQMKSNNKYGFVNEDLKVVIPPVYTWVSDFNEGAANAMKNGKVGFINKKNITLIPFEYDEAEPFKKGLAVVGRNEKYGVINRSGETIVPFIYDEIGETSNQFISVELAGKYGFIDQKGDLKVGLQYETVGDFNDGIAYVKKNGLYGVIDTNLMYIVKPKYQWIDNLKDNFIRVQEDGFYGVINKDGDCVVKPVYTQLTEIENGYSLAVKDSLYGYLNVKGEVVVDISFSYSEGVVNWGVFDKQGYARVIVNEKFGLIDTIGKRFVPALFEDVGHVSSEMIAIKRYGKWGYCDYKTKLKIPYNFDYAAQFIGDYALVKKEGLFGLIDKKGSYVIEAVYDEMTRFKEGILLVKEDGLYGLIKFDKTLILPSEYDKIEFSKDKKMLKLHSENGFKYKLVNLVFAE